MKRITYISSLKEKLSLSEIELIGQQARIKNEVVGITGILIYFDNLFFQIIEGGEDEIDALFMLIKSDHRHQNLLCLKADVDVNTRYFPEWSMKVINLDQRTDELTLPIKLLLQALIDSHHVIEKYTQSSILKTISEGINPLLLQPKQVERIIIFGDIISYSTLSEQLSIEDVFLVLNSYFEVCTRIITKKGGEVNKFIGDGLMAYFNGNDADKAIEACLEILEELEQVRKHAPDNSPLSLLYSGYGIAKGNVIEGNMGSDIKMDYTIIGDAVNTASRLESHTRIIEKSIVISELVKSCCKKDWDFVRMGQFYLKGRREHTAVYTLKNNLVDNFKDSEDLEVRIGEYVERNYKFRTTEMDSSCQ